jgi:hypothetical protein
MLRDFLEFVEAFIMRYSNGFDLPCKQDGDSFVATSFKRMKN